MPKTVKPSRNRPGAVNGLFAGQSHPAPKSYEQIRAYITKLENDNATLRQLLLSLSPTTSGGNN